MKNTITVIFFISSICLSAPDTLWTKAIGDGWEQGARSLQITSDGGFIIAGYSRVNVWQNLWLLKTDANGDTLWTIKFGDENQWIVGNSVQLTSDSGYIITGIIDGDYLLVKTDSLGTVEWNQTFDGSGNYGGESVQQTTDGGYIITGGITNDAGNPDIWLIKTDSVGDTLWTKTIGEYDDGMGNMPFDYDYGKCVKQTADGGYIITGQSGLNVVSEATVCLIKTDAQGDTLWTKNYSNYVGGSEGNYVELTSDGGYIITGWNVWNGIILIKTDSDGNQQWSNNFTYDTDYHGDYGYEVKETSDGGYIITGKSWLDNLVIIKTDSNGNELWTSQYGGSHADGGYSIKETSDGGYIVAGETMSYAEPPGWTVDVWLLRFDAPSYIPQIESISDQEISEDSTLSILLEAEHDYLYPFTFSVQSDTSAVIVNLDSNSLALSPQLNWNGSSLITVVATDTASNSGTATFTLTVNPVNDPPVLNVSLPDVNINEDAFGAVVIPKLEDYFGDVDLNDQLTFTATVLNSGLDSTGFTYVSDADSTALIAYPSLNFYGLVNISVTCTDASSTSVIDTLILTVLQINDSPILVLSDITMNEDETIEITLNAEDVEGDSLTYNGLSDTTAVIVDILEDTLSISLEENWSGNSVITVVVTDDSNASDTADFILTVNPVNDPPGIVLPDAFDFSEDGLFAVDFTPYFNDIDSDTSLVLTVAGNVYINVAIDTFLVTFTADTNWNGFEDIIFTIDDQDLRFTDSDTVRVSVLAVNDAPVITALDSVTTVEDSSTVVNLSATNVDEDTLSFSASADTSAITTNVDGTNLTLTSEADWNGTSNITVIVTDENDLSDTTDFTLTVNPVNDSPEVFSVIYPTVSDTFSTHADNDTMIAYKWYPSLDIDSNVEYTLIIELEFFSNYYTEEYENITDTTFSVSAHSLDPLLSALNLEETELHWFVESTDGEYTVSSDTGYFVLSTEALNTIGDANIPEVFALHQNYPNPFNPVTTLRYDLPENGHVSITIYDMLGRQVKTIINQYQEAGYRSVIWNATNNYGKPVSAGIYLYQIQAGEYMQTKKMVLLK